jgi:hypothetical protein
MCKGSLWAAFFVGGIYLVKVGWRSPTSTEKKNHGLHNHLSGMESKM